jgi:hypothetical protein
MLFRGGRSGITGKNAKIGDRIGRIYKTPSNRFIIFHKMQLFR